MITEKSIPCTMYFPLSNCHKNPDMCWKYIEFSLTDFFPQSASLYKALCPYWSKYCIVLKLKFFQNSVPTILKVKQLQSSAGPTFVVWDRDRDSAISGLVNGMGPGLRKTWSRRRDGIRTIIILVPKAGRDWD